MYVFNHRRVARRTAQLNGWSDVLATVAHDVTGVVKAVDKGAQTVDSVARQVDAQAPNVQAILKDPNAAYKGAVVASRASASGATPWVVAIGGGLAVAAILHLAHRRS